jgi:hypothetical protein
MAQTSVLNLFTATSYPGPIGTSVTLNGDAKQAASYYVSGKNSQTVTWSLGETFTGSIYIQASLSSTSSGGEPAETEWFSVYTIDTSNKTGFYNISGNFVWIRARVVDWTAGTIQLITVSY